MKKLCTELFIAFQRLVPQHILSRGGSILAETKKEVSTDKKEKTPGKTVQEKDREKLEQKFSKDKKETLN